MSDCLHIIVKGRVQGVCFRAQTQNQANNLNIRGFVRNLANGDVEILAQGEQDTLQQLLAWSREGPPRANVSEVIANAQPSSEVFDSFEIR
jgi:acylphosphatase